MWLESERRQVAGTTGAVLHQAALALLARGEAEDAARYASELVRLNPYEENAHVLLVRCLSAAGDHEAAARRIDVVRGDLPARARRRAEPGAPGGCREPLSCRMRASRDGRRSSPSSRRGRRRSPQARSRRASSACAAPSPLHGGSTTASRSRRRSSRWAARSSTPLEVPTRKGRRPCTKGRLSPRRSAARTSRRLGGARSAGFSSSGPSTSGPRRR